MTAPFETLAFLLADLMGGAPSVYLDTNAWSQLARRQELVSPFAEWLRASNRHLILSRFQIAELSASPLLFDGFADAAAALQPIMVDRGQHEFSGQPFHLVARDLTMQLGLDNHAFRDEFIKQLGASSLHQARGVLSEDALRFGTMVRAQLNARDARGWRDFPESLVRWLAGRCKQNSIEMHPKGAVDPKRYIGLKLSYALLYWRYVINRQPWRGKSDFVDYLHVADMAYSSVVITERNIAEALKQIRKKTNLLLPEEVYTIAWLRRL